MIIALPALGVLIQQALQAAAVGAIIGAVTGAGAGAVVEVVDGVREHGEVNREVLEDTAHAALDSAKDGALIGGVFGPVGLVAGPVVGALGNVVDDVAGQVIGQVGSAVGSTAKAVGRTVSAPFRMARSAMIARYYRRMPQLCSKGCIYIMEDTVNATRKIGVTNNPARRISEVQRDVHSNLNYVSVSPVDDAFATENALHRQLAAKNVRHPNHQTGTEWFSGLNPFDIAAVMSK